MTKNVKVILIKKLIKITELKPTKKAFIVNIEKILFKRFYKIPVRLSVNGQIFMCALFQKPIRVLK